MRYVNKSILIFGIIFAVLSLFSCKNEKVKGIDIGITLRENQSYSENMILSDLINQTLEGDEKSLKKLIYFDCGGGAGCYDLGFIVAKIVDKTGEQKFTKMITSFNSDELANLKGLIEVGLMYSYRDAASPDYNDIEKHFPIISKTISKKIKADL